MFDQSSPSTPDAGRTLHARLSDDLRLAMKSGDRVRVRTIRALMAAIDNAEAVANDDSPGPDDPIVGLGGAEAPRRRLEVATVARILDEEHDERLGAATERRQIGRPDDAVEFEAEATIIASYREALAD